MILDSFKEIDILILKKMFSMYKDCNGGHPSPVQGKILDYLYTNIDSPVFQKDLENVLHCSKVSLSEMLNKLENSGDIERVCEDGDKRKKRIILTEKSKIKMETFRKNLQDIEKTILQNFSLEDKESLELLLNKIKENLKED